jgi:hypothetical protein
MTHSSRALVVLFFSMALVLAGNASYGGSSEVAPLSGAIGSPCALTLSSATESPDREQQTLSKFLEDLAPEPRPAGEQAWPGCWQCYYGAPCCSCDQETAIISCDDYCGCW